MRAGRIISAVVGVLVLLPVSVVAVGQLMSSPVLALALLLAICGFAAVVQFRMWDRVDGYTKEMDSDGGTGGGTWGRSRTRRDPGLEMDDRTK